MVHLGQWVGRQASKGDLDFTHPLERQLAFSLRVACGGLSVGDDISGSDYFRSIVSTLEFYLPAVLREVHPIWKHESLDGVFHELAVMNLRRLWVSGTEVSREGIARMANVLNRCEIKSVA